jgi:hypothetical protein
VGRWGVGSFENDDAAGWLAKLGPITPTDLTKIFLHAADNPGYLEAPEASVAVAAAEGIAARSEEHRLNSSHWPVSRMPSSA